MNGRDIVPHFIPPESKFVLGWDLETFPGQSDVARSGRYPGAGPITLQMTNCYACMNTSVNVSGSTSGCDTINCIAMILHDASWSIMAGGQIVEYY